MKNILIVDGAQNCAYDIFQVPDDAFAVLFPGKGQNIEFVNDIVARDNGNKIDEIFKRMWGEPVKKSKANGIHGIIFYELDFKKKFYPNKMDEDLDHVGRSFQSADL